MITYDTDDWPKDDPNSVTWTHRIVSKGGAMITFKKWTTRRWIKDGVGGHFERVKASGYYLFGVIPIWIEKERS